MALLSEAIMHTIIKSFRVDCKTHYTGMIIIVSMAITVFIQKIVYLRFNFLIRYSIFSQLHYIIYSFGCLGYRLLLFLTASFTCFFSIYLSFFSDVFFREVDMSIKKSFICVRSVAFLSKNVHSVSKVGVLC